MKRLFFIILVLMQATHSMVPDTSKLFWNNFLYIDYSYGTALMPLNKIKNNFIENVKWFSTYDNPHWLKTYSPSIGIPFRNSILSVSYYKLQSIIDGKTLQEKSQLSLYLGFTAFQIEYRMCKPLNNYILFNYGLCGFGGKGESAVHAGKISHSYDIPKDDLFISYGGGGGIFGEVLFKYRFIFIGPRISANVGSTNTFKDNTHEWRVGEENKPVNFGLTGINLVLKAGILL